MLLAPDTCPEVNVAVRVNDPVEARVTLLYTCCARPLGCVGVAPVGVVLGVSEQGILVCNKDIGPVDVVPHLKTQVLQVISLARSFRTLLMYLFPLQPLYPAIISGDSSLNIKLIPASASTSPSEGGSTMVFAFTMRWRMVASRSLTLHTTFEEVGVVGEDIER